MSMKVDIDARKITQDKGIYNGSRAHQFFNNELYRVSEPYTPRKEGVLHRNATVDNTSITHHVPYAEVMWRGRRHGMDKDFNYRGAPMRGKEWTMRAFRDNQPALEKALEGYIKRR